MLRSLLIAFALSVLLVAPPGVVARQSASPRPSAGSSKKSSKSSAVRRRSTRRRSARRRTARIPRGSQRRPSRERYRQIQQALAAAGFDPGVVDGFWGPNSEKAMADFQEAHDLEPTGRIDALSLIRLGLGPQYDTPADSSKSSSGSAR